MTEHSWKTLREYDRCVAGMLADPDCCGDLLLVGMWMARATILHDPEPGETGSWKFSDAADALFRPRNPNRANRRYGRANVLDVVRSDIPRYDPAVDHGTLYDLTCQAPMIRRSGVCGKQARFSGYSVDLGTGRQYPAGSCSRHRAWSDAAYRANTAAVKAAGSSLPQPPQNTGGVLARHIPRIGWTKIYRHFQEGWVQPPQGEASFVPPKLQLLTFEPDKLSRASGAPQVTPL